MRFQLEQLFKCFNYTQNNLAALPFMAQNATHSHTYTHWLICNGSYSFFHCGWLGCRRRIYIFFFYEFIYMNKMQAFELSPVFNVSIWEKKNSCWARCRRFYFIYIIIINRWISLATSTKASFQSCQVRATMILISLSFDNWRKMNEAIIECVS